MLGPAHGVQDCARLVGPAGGGKGLVDSFQILGRSARGPGHGIDSVAFVVVAQQVDHAARVFEADIAQGHALVIQFKGPGFCVVCAFVSLKA